MAVYTKISRRELNEIAADYGRAPAATLKSWRQKILTSDDPHRVHRALEEAFDDFAWSAAA